jgi:hypothetical protein
VKSPCVRAYPLLANRNDWCNEEDRLLFRWTNHSYEALQDTWQQKHLLRLFPFTVPTQTKGFFLAFTLVNYSAPHNCNQISLLRTICLHSSQSITLNSSVSNCYNLFLSFCSVPFSAICTLLLHHLQPSAPLSSPPYLFDHTKSNYVVSYIMWKRRRHNIY